MVSRRPILLLLAGFASARAQTATSGVAESIDPAKAAAVERAARDLKARQAQAAASGVAPPAVGVVRGRGDGDIAFLSGGVAEEDRVAMHAERDRFSLWVATVAKPSGAYLVDARLRIVGVDGRRVVFERTMDGPWLFVALPAGSYEVRATLTTEGHPGPQELSTRVRIGTSGQRQAVFRFASTAEVSPDMDSSFKGNPFAVPGTRR